MCSLVFTQFHQHSLTTLSTYVTSGPSKLQRNVGNVNVQHTGVKWDQTYNIHDGKDVVLNVLAPVVAHHHFVGHHQSLNKTLCTNGAPLPVAVVKAAIILLR